MRMFPATIGLTLGSHVPDVPVRNDASNIEVAIYNLLATDVAVNLLVETRIYPNLVPQKASMPAITYQEISAEHSYTMNTVSVWLATRMQLNCWADSYAGAKNLMNAVEIALNGYSGINGQVKIKRIRLTNSGDMPEAQAGKDKLTMFGKRIDLEIQYKIV